MKATGIVRKVDDLGRLVLPVELRRSLALSIQDPLEIYVEGDHIILKKYEPACIFCLTTTDVIRYKHKNICMHCVKTIHEGFDAS